MQVSTHDHFFDWLHRRGISDEVLRLFNVTVTDHPQIGPALRIPFSSTHAKYRRDPMDPEKPKYVYDVGGKVTLYGYDKLPMTIQHPAPIVITEGELDTLVLRSLNILAVTSTGGAMTFQEEWAEYPHIAFAHKMGMLYLCFDNDDAGAEGMVRTLKFLPEAKIIFIPELPGIKDISDYVASGKDFHTLLQTARSYPSLTAVEEDRLTRSSQWLPVRFHDAYLDKHRTPRTLPEGQKYLGDDILLKAKSYPLTNLLEFKQKKTVCPFHNEKTPSLQYYPQSNHAYCFGCGKTVDAIDLYRLKYNVSFSDAVESLSNMV